MHYTVNIIMANISLRKLDEQVYRQLRQRAALHGVSMEEEARQIISLVVSAPEQIGDVFKKHFGVKQGIDLEALHQDRRPHDPLDLNQ